MKDIADQDRFAVKGENSSAFAKNWSKGLVTHADVDTFDKMVGDEGTLIRKHVVGGASISNDEATLRGNVC
jgi:hypothetical protein